MPVIPNPINGSPSRIKFRRRSSPELYKKVIQLRRNEHSYTEIMKETGLAKSTINNWLAYSGMTLTKEHLEIRKKKAIENHIIGTAASRVTRARRREKEIQTFLAGLKTHFDDPIFTYGIALFVCEGSKSDDCKFSNSDFRLVDTFLRFTEKYLAIDRYINASFSLYIHESRNKDLNRILNFWSRKMSIPNKSIRIYWKRNKIVGRKENMDYVGQMSVRISGIGLLGSKLLAVSDIILKKHLR